MMNWRKIIPGAITLGLMALALAIYFIPSIPKTFATTTTITGWNVPSAKTLTNGIVAFIMPVAVMAMFVGFPLIFEQRGDIIVTMALVGFLVGSVASMLNFPGSSGVANTPFVFAILAGTLLGIWLWKGNG